MAMNTTASVWTTAPERHFRDLASPAAKDVDQLREAILQIGLSALSSSDTSGLILPPPKHFAPKRLEGHKDLHHHRYLEIGIVTKGEMTIWWEGSTAQCPAGSVFVIPPGVRYLPHADVPGRGKTPHSVVWLALHRGCAVVHMCSLKDSVHQLSEYYSFTEAQVTNVARSISQELAERSPQYDTVIRGALLCLFTWLQRAPVHRISRMSGTGKDAKPGEDDTFSNRVESYFLSHYHRPISLSQVASSMGCSPAHLCRHFRTLTGQTPFQFLRDVRIEAAKRLLCSEVPIARVAEMVGFDDPLYFSKVFSGRTGESPHSFRVRARTEGFKELLS
ncbi:MAG: AraC family transcriptional regulator [Capsulimonas sp.]|jgi:AraC-like DNA-binding protein/mannose-6-phosphate isomerase-like protein (cupin superfamily)|nr:AraC family transcriptional regulator [Capsulimonas sp.]